MKFQLEINCDGAAFAEGACDELGRILAKLADRMDWGADPYMPIVDINGNQCGFARFVNIVGDRPDHEA